MPDDATPHAPRPPRRRPPVRQRPPPEPAEGRVAVGRVLRPRGRLGELRVEPLTDFPQRFAKGARLWIGDTEYAVESSRSHQGALLVRLAGIDDPAGAATLRDRLLEVPESELPKLPPDTYYRYQLIGIEVWTTDGSALGHIVDVLDTGANEVFVVRGEAGETLVPAIGDVVREVDVAARRMTIEPIEGLLPEPRRQRGQ